MLASVAEELYALAPGDFTAARNQHAKNAKASGDKDLAEKIARLPKPSVAAWVVNLLARQRPDVVVGVVELGDALRDAQVESDRDKLKELSRQRQDLLRSVAALGLTLAGESGHKVPSTAAAEVEQTLQAAMADPDAAGAVLSGRLTRTLASTGIEPVDLRDAVAGPAGVSNAATRKTDAGKAPSRKAPPRTTATRKTANQKPAPQHKPLPDRAFQRRLDEARDRADLARQRVQQARSERDSAQATVQSLEPQRHVLAAELVDLKNRIADLEHQLAAVEREFAAAERELAAAERSVGEAERAAREANQRLERLSG